MRIPYIKLFMAEWAAYRRVLSAEQICEKLDFISDYLNAGIEPNHMLFSEAEKNFFNGLLKSAQEARKTYASNVTKGKKGGRPKKLQVKVGDKVQLKLQPKATQNTYRDIDSSLRSESISTPVNISNEISTGDDARAKVAPMKIIESWNAIARKHGRPTLRTFPPDLKRNFAARLKDEQITPDEFFTICNAALEKDESMRNGTETWPGASFDYFCRPKNFRRAWDIAESSVCQNAAASMPESEKLPWDCADWNSNNQGSEQ